MADPIDFFGANATMNPAEGDEGRVRAMPATVDPLGRVISCWKLAPEEHLRVIETGEVWLSLACGGKPQPSYVSGMPLMVAFDPDTGAELDTYCSDGSHAVAEARRFAILHHGEQKYGKRPYAYHLDGVVANLVRWGYGWVEQIAGYGHDLIEDTMQDLPVQERRVVLAQRFNAEIELLIWCCTGTRVSREECLEEQIFKIKMVPKAAPVKCADRLFNMRSCLEDLKEAFSPRLLKLAQTYADEADIFIAAMTPLVSAQIIDELREAADALHAYISNHG
ncbi:hypothetical protein KIKIMORA_02420 [Brevundimonas phage vB_BpoS-Kikimora]|uniref:Uncharacterized protein n=1 Tax=Brevundimonas phage vB_BpoS-Kikimora TaxID=2948601 RepID=A0A9E7MS43_9CAUD|nr:hypothetical protein KIKIMORA_02420 [Brevundimonas phage vB_BpoS-Kikimora]